MRGYPVEKGTISIRFVEEALVGVRERGLDPAPLLHQAGISPELFEQAQARVSARQYAALWHQIARRMDDEFFGMDRHRMKAGSFTLLCHAVIHSDTLARALLRALRFFRLILDDFSGELFREGDTARIVLHEHHIAPEGQAPPPLRAFAYGTFLIMLHGLACWLVARRIPLLRADFRCAEPNYSEEWRVLFTHNLHFEQAESAIAFPAEYLDLPNVQNETTMKAFLREAPANFLVEYHNSTSLSARIRRRLRELPPAEWPDFATLAERFHTSASTLRRHLEQEGQSYRSILDDLRRDLAISLLSDTERSLMDIAAELGFAETSAFHRAFRRWTGSRPGEYRPDRSDPS